MACAMILPLPAQGVPGVDIEGPFVRVKRNQDGSRTVFERGQDERTLVKTTEGPNGNVVLKTIYRLDSDGNPLRCNIYNGTGKQLYKTAFGYSKRPGVTYGRLVQELLYDTKEERFFDGTRTEKPVHMFVYRYNADGSPRLPIGITLIKGKTAEEVFGRSVSPQVLPNLKELEEGKPANPNARPLRQNR